MRDHLYQAAKLRHDAFIVDQEIERSKSRAVMVRERNLMMLNAAKEDPGKARPAKIKEWQSLIGSATRYLQALEEQLLPEVMVATRWRAEADRFEERASRIQAELSRPVEHGQVAGKPSAAQSLQPPAQSIDHDQLPFDPAIRAIALAAKEHQRRQREADEEFMEIWLRHQRNREAADSEGAREPPPPDEAQLQRNKLETRTAQRPPSDFGLEW